MSNSKRDSFWDPGAYAAVTIRDPQTGVASTGYQAAQGIVSFLAADDPSMPWPEELSNWETIYFDGRRAPGLCRVTGGRRRRIDEKVSWGTSGSAVSILGYAPAEFTIVLRLWTAAQLAQFEALAKVLYPRGDQQVSGLAPPQTGFVATLNPQQPPIPLAPSADLTAAAIRVTHPAFAVIGVYDVYVEDLRVPEHIGSQIFEATIDVTEWYPPTADGVKPMKFSTGENANGTTQFKTLPADPSVTSIGPN